MEFDPGKKKLDNPYVAYYSQNAISPVRQDLSNLPVHLTRRENLYRILGIPRAMFRDRRILEVGPGGGYNALAFFTWGANIDFVEPNPTAQQELNSLLKSYQIATERWSLFPGLVEDFSERQLYDVVIAEGFIPGLYERDTVIAKLKTLVSPGGVIVVTCFDELSTFFDVLKRLVGQYLIKEINDFNGKVRLLCQAFDSHLKALSYVSRPTEDWVKDLVLNPAVHGKLFSISDCIEEFGPEFQFLGSSPAMFTNYQWYKNVDFDYRDNVINQFKLKRHTLLLWDMPESTRTAAENESLSDLVLQIRHLAYAFEQVSDLEARPLLFKILVMLKDFILMADGIDKRISKAVQEVISLLLDEGLDADKVSRSQHFGQAFGRGQQYVSLQKDVNF